VGYCGLLWVIVGYCGLLWGIAGHVWDECARESPEHSYTLLSFLLIGIAALSVGGWRGCNWSLSYLYNDLCYEIHKVKRRK
jgi:hypothetical protein